jgi:hypothetical protein
MVMSTAVFVVLPSVAEQHELTAAALPGIVPPSDVT